VQCGQRNRRGIRKSEAATFQKQIEKENFKKPLRIVEGGEHRQNSVANALAAIKAADDDIVLIHDAVRPFVDQETIVNVIEAVKKYEAAIAGVPAIDTVKQVDRTADGAVVIATVPRERMVLAQTPQGFRFGLLKKAFDEAMADGFMGTDEASLIERSWRSGSRCHGFAAQHEDHHSRRPGAGRVLPLAGEPRRQPERVTVQVT
jgi:2-C-methyl-D-erythritol 4-phosphate cytidylyltransferase